MRDCKISCVELGEKIEDSLKKQKLSVRKCCELFNATYTKQIDAGIVKRLDKDFVQRVRSNRFKVVTPRVIMLCDFLGVETNKPRNNTLLFEEELILLNRAATRQPVLRSNIHALLKNLISLAELGG